MLRTAQLYARPDGVCRHVSRTEMKKKALRGTAPSFMLSAIVTTSTLFRSAAPSSSRPPDRCIFPRSPDRCTGSAASTRGRCSCCTRSRIGFAIPRVSDTPEGRRSRRCPPTPSRWSVSSSTRRRAPRAKGEPLAWTAFGTQNDASDGPSRESPSLKRVLRAVQPITDRSSR